MSGAEAAEFRRQKRNRLRRKRKLAHSLFAPPSYSEMCLDLWKRRYAPEKMGKIGANSDLATTKTLRGLWRAKRRFQLGSWASLIDAISLCNEVRWPLPAWAVKPLATSAPGALLGLPENGALPARLRQIEAKRLQRQKWCQVFYAIKDFEDVLFDEPLTYLDIARHPEEVPGLTLEAARSCTNDAERLALVFSLLRKQNHPLFTRSESTIIKGLKELREEVHSQFGSHNDERILPQTYIWDISFVEKSTIYLLST